MQIQIKMSIKNINIWLSYNKSFDLKLILEFWLKHYNNKGIGDAGSTADIRMLWP